MERKTEFITDYIINYDLDIEKMILDFKDYILSIVDRSSKGILKYEDKEEIVSDVFLSVWHNKKRIDNTKPLKCYIAGITKNLIRTKFKNLKKFENDTLLEEKEIVDLNNIDIICEEDEINQVIAQELNNMKKKDYEIFCKYYYLSKSIKEISNELNISESNVKVRLHRIRKKLKVNLSKKGIIAKIVPVVLVICFVTGVTFAKQILEFISVKFFNASEGVDTAVENGYLQKIDMEYQNGNNTENNSDVGVKVDYILMDDFYLNIVFNIDLQETNNLSGIDFDSLVITDEENNLLLTKFENRSKYQQFCEENGIEKTFNHMAIGTYNSSNLVYDYKNSNYTSSYTIRTFEDSFPRARKLSISFDSIILYTGKRNR